VWCRVVGDGDRLLVLRGGPVAPHDCLAPLAAQRGERRNVS
jgi:hypothetical protein